MIWLCILGSVTWRLFLLFLIPAVLSANSSYAAIACNKIVTIGLLAQNIRNWRQTRIAKTDKKWISVNNVSYDVQGILGEASSIVYLANAPDGKPVAIKIIEADLSGWLNSIYYEIAATKFYLEMGVIVPEIRDFEVNFSVQLGTTVGVLVKEYREGITREELDYLIHARSGVWADAEKLLLDDFKVESKRLRAVHKKFAQWLKKNNIKLPPFKQLKSLISEGDFSEENDNFIFDSALGRWILFDP